MSKIRSILLVVAFLFVTSCAGNTRTPWTTMDKALLVGSLVTSAADLYTTHDGLQNHNMHELNPILGKHPSDTRLVLTTVAFNAIVIFVADRVPSLRKWLLGGKMVGNGISAYRNKRLIDESQP